MHDQNERQAVSETAPKRHRRLTELFLAALERPPVERPRWIAEVCDDESLGRELEAMLDAHERSQVFLDRPVLDVGLRVLAAGDRDGGASPFERNIIGRYRLLREIGRGGMGVVHEAVRTDLPGSKSVAVKILSPGLDTDAVRRRFQAEYRILADLQHPFVAKLLDGGTTDDGLPFFVMERVEGEPIDLSCDERRLSVAERIRLFRKVCEAVEYAHRNLIVHRDIKPGNILVDAEGTPKLLDFGIAKVIRAGDDTLERQLTQLELTQTGGRPLTLAYAAPEQIQGNPITTAVDVYGLGVLLYKLLTGGLPHDFQGVAPENLARVIVEEPPDKPSSAALREPFARCAETPEKLSRRLAGDLDVIVLTALRKDPNRRYGSVERFSEDLGRYLDGLPVRARPETIAYRLGRFLQRNRLPATAAFIALISLATGAAVAWRGSLRAEQSRLRAEAERRVSLERTKDVRELANTMMSKLHDEIAPLPGSTPVRRMMVAESLTYLDRLNRQGEGDESLWRELAVAYRKVGDVQGRPFAANLGDTRGALGSYRKSLELFERLAAAKPDDAELASESATARERMGEVLFRIGDLRQAKTWFLRAKPLRGKLAERVPVNPEFRYRKAVWNVRMSDIARAEGDLIEAFELCREALETCRSTPESAQTAALRRQVIGSCHSRMSWILETAGDIGTAQLGKGDWIEAFHRRALVHGDVMLKPAESALRAAPDNPILQREVAGCRLRKAAMLVKTGNVQEAEPLLRAARRAFERLGADDAKNIEYRLQTARVYQVLAEFNAATGRTNEAVDFGHRAVSLLGPIFEADQANFENGRLLAGTLDTTAAVCAKAGKRAEAIRLLTKSVDLRSRLAESQPEHVISWFERIRTVNALTRLLIETGRVEEARILTETLLNELGRQADSSPENKRLSACRVWLSISGFPVDVRDPQSALATVERGPSRTSSPDFLDLVTHLTVYARIGHADQARTSARQVETCFPADVPEPR